MMKKTRLQGMSPDHPDGQTNTPESASGETQKERFVRLKQTADATGRRLIRIWLEDERKRQKNQR